MGVKFKRGFARWLILPLLALLVAGITEFFSANPVLAENLYAQQVYPLIASVLSPVSAIFPFSLSDVFYFLLICSFFLVIFLLIIRKISFKQAANKVIQVVAGVYILFYLLWGFNYFRPGITSRLGIKEADADTEEFLARMQQIVNELNSAYCSSENFDKKKIDSLIDDSYSKLSDVLGLHYPCGRRNPKSITLSGFFARAGITGYLGPFFNEVHVNSKVLPVEYPFIVAHEMAHQFGITSEAEANFYAWLVCVQSNSDELSYSANMAVLRYFLSQGFQLEGIRDVLAELDEGVKEDYRKIRAHWMELRNEKVEKVASKVNDAYLKTNKVKKGIEDYHGVVKYMMDFSLDSTFQKKTARK